MGEARLQNEWAHTSSLLALIANVNRDPKKARAFKPADFNPHSKPDPDAPKPMADITVLKQIFIDSQPPKVQKQ